MKLPPVVTLCAIAFFGSSFSFPMYGGKRYARTWSPLPMPIYAPRDARPYASYYDPYQQEYADVMDFYYPQDPYDKYRIFQLPYYYSEQPPYYYGYEESEPVEDVDRVQGDKDSYGQETWFENSPRAYDSNAEANAYFLENLIYAQMFKDAATKGQRYPITFNYPREDYDDSSYIYGEPVRNPSVPTKEDEDVRELKSLMPDKQGSKQQYQKKINDKSGSSRRSFPDNQWSPGNKKRSEKKVLTTPTTPVTTQRPKEKGQEEVVMLRPATPPRQPSFLYHTRDHEPSVYDAIKKLLHMQELDEKNDGRYRKRSLIPSEDSLVEELGNLKKSA